MTDLKEKLKYIGTSIKYDVEDILILLSTIFIIISLFLPWKELDSHNYGFIAGIDIYLVGPLALIFALLSFSLKFLFPKKQSLNVFYLITGIFMVSLCFRGGINIYFNFNKFFEVLRVNFWGLGFIICTLASILLFSISIYQHFKNFSKIDFMTHFLCSFSLFIGICFAYYSDSDIGLGFIVYLVVLLLLLSIIHSFVGKNKRLNNVIFVFEFVIILLICYICVVGIAAITTISKLLLL